MNIEPRTHILPDVLAPGLRVVFCGTAASTVSAARGAYYAGPGNLFWPTLHQIGLVPKLLAAAEFRQVITWGIGLTDIAKTVSGPDSCLPKGCFDRQRFLARIAEVSPFAVAFNGKRAAKAALGSRRELSYGPISAGNGLPLAFVLPSTSRRACRFWDIGPWIDLANSLPAAGCAPPPNGQSRL